MEMVNNNDNNDDDNNNKIAVLTQLRSTERLFQSTYLNQYFLLGECAAVSFLC